MNESQPIKAEVVTMTPVRARELLVLNTENYRPIRPSKVQQYKGAIKRGEWKLNGEAIRTGFNESGEIKLKDGQNRLTACIEANANFVTLLVENLPVGSEDTMDIGAKRSLADILRRRGEVSVSTLAAALKQIYAYEIGMGVGGSLSGPQPTAQQLISVLERHPGLRDTLLPIESKFMGKLLTNSVMGSLSYLFNLANRADAEEFFRLLATGDGLQPGNAIYHLRNILVKDQSKRHNRMSPRIRAALTIKAFNYWREGRVVNLLTWKPGGANPESYPTIQGCPVGLDERGNVQIPAVVVNLPAMNQDIPADQVLTSTN